VRAYIVGGFMKVKIYILCAVFIAATAVWAQSTNSDTIKQKGTVVTANQNNQTDKSKSVRSIPGNQTKGNWSKIKDLFL
jgi:hypothetical protein